MKKDNAIQKTKKQQFKHQSPVIFADPKTKQQITRVWQSTKPWINAGKRTTTQTFIRQKKKIKREDEPKNETDDKNDPCDKVHISIAKI